MIALPNHFDFEIAQGNGLVFLSSITGELVLTLGNGEINLDNVKSAKINAQVGNGKIDADIALTDSGQVTMNVGVGQLNLRIPKNTEAEVDVESALGEITYTGLGFDNLRVSKTHLEGTLGDGKGDIALSVGIGIIEMRGK